MKNMINRNEILIILVVSIILGFSISLIETWNIFLNALLTIFLVILINVFAKKVAAYYLDSEAEVKLWNIERMNELKVMLNFEHRPSDEKTGYIESVNTFKERKVLPKPSKV